MKESQVRVFAMAAATGIAAFISAWVTSGASTDGYSPTHDAISRLAATGASTRVTMTAGLLLLAAGLCASAVVLRDRVEGAAWIAAVASAIATLGVAAVPLGSALRDPVHGAFATAGYAALAAVPMLAAGPLGTRWPHAMAIARAAAVATAGCLAATAFVDQRGLFQRAGLTITHAWIAAVALRLAWSRPRRTG